MYSQKVMDHFMNPRNVGKIDLASGVGNPGRISASRGLYCSYTGRTADFRDRTLRI